MICPNCKTEIRDRKKFCGTCGAVLGSVEPPRSRRALLTTCFLLAIFVATAIGWYFWRHAGSVATVPAINAKSFAVPATIQPEAPKEADLPRAIATASKGGGRSACFLLGSGERSIENTDGGGYSQLNALVRTKNYQTQTITLTDKAGIIPKDCTIVIVGGPTSDYPQPEVDALKNFVEAGGRALFMLDPPLKFAEKTIDDNQALTSMLSGWGVTADKDLVLDTSGKGQKWGMGPELPVVTDYGVHPIVRSMTGVATGFHLARSLEVPNKSRTTVEKLFYTSASSFATSNLNSAQIKPTPNDKKGPLTIGVAGTIDSDKEGNGRFVVVGSSEWVANSLLHFEGNQDLFMNVMNWLLG